MTTFALKGRIRWKRKPETNGNELNQRRSLRVIERIVSRAYIRITWMAGI